MNSKSCKDCAAWQHNTYREWHYCAQGQGDIRSGNSEACKYFKPATVFQQIIASPEVLADKLVYHTVTSNSVGLKMSGYKSTIVSGFWAEREDAISETLTKLKEVAE